VKHARPGWCTRIPERRPQVSLLCLHYVFMKCAAQGLGWAVCPAKSLPARAIEESVLGRVREESPGVFDPAEREQIDRVRRVEAIQSVVETVGYYGNARQISIRIHAAAAPEVQG
jgi:hypothetical protein